MVILFFGGWHSPSLASNEAHLLIKLIVFAGKVTLMILFYMLVRWTLPRFRFDQLMGLAWKVLIPLAIVNVVCVMIVKQLDASPLWLLPVTLGVLVGSAWLGTLSAPITPGPRMAIRGGGQSAD